MICFWECAMRSLLLLVTSGCALLSASCSDSSSLHAVRGKVLFKGEPAVGATVTFIRKRIREALKTPISSGDRRGETARSR